MLIWQACLTAKDGEEDIIPKWRTQAEVELIGQEVMPHVILFDLTKPRGLPVKKVCGKVDKVINHIGSDKTRK